MSRIRCLGFSLLLLSAVMLGEAFAQSPIPAQMELFRQLPPAEQERLMREYGVQRPAQGADRSQQAPGGDAPRNCQDADAREGVEREPIIDEATDIERMMPLALLSAMTGVIFNLAVAVAAVNSF